MGDTIKINDRTRVIFLMPDGTEIECSIRKGKLRVECDGRMVIKPEATNVVSISAEI